MLAILRKYVGPRSAVFLPPLAPSAAAGEAFRSSSASFTDAPKSSPARLARPSGSEVVERMVSASAIIRRSARRSVLLAGIYYSLQQAVACVDRARFNGNATLGHYRITGVPGPPRPARCESRPKRNRQRSASCATRWRRRASSGPRSAGTRDPERNRSIRRRRCGPHSCAIVGLRPIPLKRRTAVQIAATHWNPRLGLNSYLLPYGRWLTPMGAPDKRKLVLCLPYFCALLSPQPKPDIVL